MEQPVLRLGLIGFSLVEDNRIGAVIGSRSDGWPIWELAPFDKADGWWINGPCISKIDREVLTLQTRDPAAPQLKLNPTEINRPIAFAKPLPVNLQVSEIVDTSSEAAMRLQLQRFEAWLRPLRAQFALGAELVQRENEMRRGVFQITVQGKLVAIVDLYRWRAALLATARPVDFEGAAWDKRPQAAGDVPSGFIQISISQLMWIYASRTFKDILPARYRRETIYLRQMSHLAGEWLHHEHLVLLREIKVGGLRFTDLLLRTGLEEGKLSRALAALYFGGAITTNPRSAGRSGVVRPSNSGETLPPMEGDSNLPSWDQNSRLFSQNKISRRKPEPSELTAPAPLLRE